MLRGRLNIGAKIRQTLLAQDCVLCGEASGDTPLCAACHDDLPRVVDACPMCAGPSVAAKICGACLTVSPSFDATLAVWRYEFPLDRLLQALKYGGRLALARAFGQALAAQVATRRIDAIVPMPLAPARIADRGFNQAVEIARVVAERSGIAIASRVVQRVRNTLPQTDLPHDARAANVRGAFACTGTVVGMALAVIDDVMTTGATLEELARTLKRAGAERVENWVVARTWPR